MLCWGHCSLANKPGDGLSHLYRPATKQPQRIQRVPDHLRLVRRAGAGALSSWPRPSGCAGAQCSYCMYAWELVRWSFVQDIAQGQLHVSLDLPCR